MKNDSLNSKVPGSFQRFQDQFCFICSEFIIKPQLLNGNNNGHISNQKGSVTTHV